MLHAYGLYTHIRANEIRSRILVVGLFGLVLVLAYGVALVGRGSTQELPGGMPPTLSSYMVAAAGDMVWLGPIAFAGALLWLLIAYRLHQRLIDATVGTRSVTRIEEPRLYRLLEDLCIARGIPMPALRIAEDAALNAFATGLNQRQYAITVTRGLLVALDDREIESVLAHELTHIRNDDVRTMMIAIVIAGIFAFVAELVFRGVGSFGDSSGGNRRGSGDDRGKGGALLAILIGFALVALVWFLSQLIRFALSRSREFVADAGAVELTKNPDAMISALQKISGRGELARAPSGVMELCVDNPRSGFFDLFATHPAIDDRIAALSRYAGGRLPAPS